MDFVEGEANLEPLGFLWIGCRGVLLVFNLERPRYVFFCILIQLV